MSREILAAHRTLTDIPSYLIDMFILWFLSKWDSNARLVIAFYHLSDFGHQAANAIRRGKSRENRTPLTLSFLFATTFLQDGSRPAQSESSPWFGKYSIYIDPIRRHNYFQFDREGSIPPQSVRLHPWWCFITRLQRIFPRLAIDWSRKNSRYPKC